MAMSQPDLRSYRRLKDDPVGIGEGIIEQLETRFQVQVEERRAQNLLRLHRQDDPRDRRKGIYPPQAVDWLANYFINGTDIPLP
jgi:hypothetical protein